MDGFLIALAGGSVGAILTWLFGQGAGLLAIPGEVATHERLAGERDDDLAQWVADDHLRLTRELRAITNTMAAPGEGQGSQLYAGAHGRALADAKERALHSYRDQERLAERFIAGLTAQEDGRHSAYRRQEDFAPLNISAPERVQPVLDRWRDASWGHPLGVDPVDVNDPTRRTLARTIEELQAANGRSP